MAFEVSRGGHGNIHLNFAVHTIYQRQQQVEHSAYVSHGWNGV